MNRGNFFDVVDASDRASTDMERMYGILVALGRTTVLRYENQPNTVMQMGSDILAKCGPKGAYLVRIWGHGIPGTAGISAGQHAEFAHNNSAALFVTKDFATDTVRTSVTPTLLRPLVHAMNPVGRLEMHGCSVAAGKVGELLCKGLAKYLSCWVYASTQFQLGLAWVPPVMGYPPGGGAVISNATPPPLVWLDG